MGILQVSGGAGVNSHGRLVGGSSCLLQGRAGQERGWAQVGLPYSQVGTWGRERWPWDLTQRSAPGHFPARHTLGITWAEEENSCCTISSLFTPLGIRTDASRGAGVQKHPWGWFNEGVPKVLQFHRKPKGNYIEHPSPSLFSGCLAFCSSLALIPILPLLFSSLDPIQGLQRTNSEQHGQR